MNAVVEFQRASPGGAVALTGSMSVDDVVAHARLVQQVMKALMKEGVHYGTIPGTDKPTLLKPGAELLCMTFHIAAAYAVEDLSTEIVVRYRVTCTGGHQGTGTVLGTGMGECSSGEEKYKWIKAWPEEFEATPENLRRKKHGWDKQKRQKYEVLQIRTDPANLANTVLKMANKRAYLAMVLSVLAASDCFSQDLDDMDDRLREHLARNGEDYTGPEGGAGTDGAATDSQKGQPAGKQPYPAEKFSANLPKWRKKIEAGEKKGQEYIDWLETSFTVSPDQKSAILAPFGKDGAQAAAETSPAGTTALGGADADPFTAPTFAEVAEKITKAENLDGLATAGDLIRLVADEALRPELQAKYDAREKELQS